MPQMAYDHVGRTIGELMLLHNGWQMIRLYTGPKDAPECVYAVRHLKGPMAHFDNMADAARHWADNVQGIEK